MGDEVNHEPHRHVFGSPQPTCRGCDKTELEEVELDEAPSPFTPTWMKNAQPQPSGLFVFYCYECDRQAMVSPARHCPCGAVVYVQDQDVECQS